MLQRVCSSSAACVHFVVLPYFYVICDLYHLGDKFKLEMGLKLEYTSWSSLFCKQCLFDNYH